MLNRVVELSLRMRTAVIAIAVLLFTLGLYSAMHAPLDVFPDFVPPQVTVQTEAPGLSAEQVEELVTRPVENAIRGTGGLEALRSQSIQGLSVITAVFADDADVFRARQLLGEALANVATQLPAPVRAPRMTPLTSSTMDLLKIGLLSDTLSPMELRTFAQWTLRPRLLAVPGVANVSMFGGDVQQLQIQVKPDRLEAFGLTIQDVLSAARSSTGVRGAGFIETPNQRIVLQTDGRSAQPAELREVVLARRDGRSLLLGDVADVVFAAEPKYGDALVQGRPGVLMTMLAQYGANTMDVTRGVESALEELKPAIAARGATLYPRLHRPATFVENSIHGLERALAIGAILVAIVLFLFLYNVRTALISLVAIPLSLAAAMLALRWMGHSMNTMTLGGLAIALGEVVDDAIIDVENIFRRLRENRALAEPRAAFQVVLEASIEVRSAVVYATFVVVLVFVPVLTMSGLQGRLFAPLGLAYVFAILASLVVALTVTPALALILLPKRAARASQLGLLVAAKGLYVRVLRAISRRTAIVAGIAILLFAGAVALIPQLGGEFLPEFKEGHFVLQVTAVPGTSLEAMKSIGAVISRELLGDKRIATVEQQIGRAELGEDTWGPNRSEFHVELATGLDEEDEDAVQDEIRSVLARHVEVKCAVLTFLGDRIQETISGETAAVVVNVFGDDLDVLESKGHEIAAVLTSTPGAVDVQEAVLPGSPQVSVTLRPDRLAEFGFRPVEVLEAIEVAFQGAKVAETSVGSHVYDVAVILAAEDRATPNAIRSLRVRNAEGAAMPLENLADIETTSGRALLLHEGGRRRATITCNVDGRDIASFVDDAQRAVAKDVKSPEGTYVSFGGTAAQAATAKRELWLHSALAGLGILLLLSMVFQNARNLALVLANLPFALVGGVVAAWLAGGTLSIGSMVGFVTLFGITTRNSIMMISHFEHLVQVEGCTWNLETALRGASERFSPVLMTALVTGLGLLPLVIGGAATGREIEGPMATVILGGLATSTVLNLLVLPSLALKFGRFGAR